MQSIELEASLPPGAKQKLDDGLWRVIGAVVQDASTGRMVANLKTVEKKANTDYTPALFVAIQDEIFVSQQLISAHISEEISKLTSVVSQGLRQIEQKVDTQTDIMLGMLNGQISYFFLEFEHLEYRDMDTANAILRSGGETAAKLARITDVFINEYFDAAEMTIGQGLRSQPLTMNYKAYQADSASHQRWYVKSITYPDLRQSRIHQFIPALIEMMNRLNIISVCFRQKLFMGYADTLNTLRCMLMTVLKRLVFGLDVHSSGHDDYAQRVFGKDKNGKWIEPNDADRLAQYYQEFSRNELGARVFQQVTRTQDDWTLVYSVREVLNMIDSIDNLLQRGEELERGAIRDSESITLLREQIFPSRQNPQLLSDKT